MCIRDRTKSIGADCILVADDEATTNSLKMTTLRLAKPQGVKLVVKSIDDSIDVYKRQFVGRATVRRLNGPGALSLRPVFHFGHLSVLNGWVATRVLAIR